MCCFYQEIVMTMSVYIECLYNNNNKENNSITDGIFSWEKLAFLRLVAVSD